MASSGGPGDPSAVVVRLRSETPDAWMVDTNASEIVGAALGLAPERVREIVASYRSVASALDTEPEWTVLMTMGGEGGHHVVSVAEGTQVQKVSVTPLGRKRTGSITSFAFKGVPFEFFREARAFEMRFDRAVRTGDERLIDEVMSVIETHGRS